MLQLAGIPPFGGDLSSLTAAIYLQSLCFTFAGIYSTVNDQRMMVLRTSMLPISGYSDTVLAYLCDELFFHWILSAFVGPFTG